MTIGEPSARPSGQQPSAEPPYERFHELLDLRDRVRAEVVRAGHQDLAAVLDELPIAGGHRKFRVVVAGETKRGKSTLVNTLVGRPLLSPVGFDVTTACWLELSHGDRDEAVALLADPASPAAPRRVPFALREIEQYVALTEITDPVLGVEVRVPAPLLRDIVLVDTPGVGGLHAGHSKTTLAALGQADSLLFVCDATQPVLAPELDFLVAAAARLPTIVIALTKCDLNPGFEVVLAETRSLVAQRPELAGVPVFPVAATLATRAADMENEAVSARLAELSGMAPLIATLTRQTAAGSDAHQLANVARVIGSVARILAGRIGESTAGVSGDPDRERALGIEIGRLTELLDDRVRISTLVQQHLAQLRTEPLDSFDAVVSEVRQQYRTEAERGPAAQLNTLAPRMVADLTAGGAATLESAAEQTTEVMRRLLKQTGADHVLAELPARGHGALDFDLQPPEAADEHRATGALTHAAGVFSTLMELMGGAATVVSVLTGPGVIAASIALAACAGWWKVRGDTEQQRRAQLRSWVDSAATEAQSRFGQELKRRIQTVEQYVQAVLPELLSARQQRLALLQAELETASRAGARGLSVVGAGSAGLIPELESLTSEADALVAALRETRGIP